MFSKLARQFFTSHVRGPFIGGALAGLLVSLLFGSVGQWDFPPLQPILDWDMEFYYALTTPPGPDAEAAQNVILVDVNDDAMVKAGHKPDDLTPRALIAHIIHRVREANPAAVFVDIDLRDPAADDAKLLTELSRPKVAPVLLAYDFDAEAPLSCKGQAQQSPASRPELARTPFDAALMTGSVYRVHSILEPDSHGMITGVCSSYAVRTPGNDQATIIPAAMLQAYELGLAHFPGATLPPRQPASVIRTLWRIRDKHQSLPNASGRQLYRWVPAERLDWPGMDLSALRDALVIVAATHKGSEDLHPTTAGKMLGSLVHANVAMNLGARTGHGRWSVKPLVLDAALTLFGAYLSARFVWGRFHEKTPEVERNALRILLHTFYEALILSLYWLLCCLSVIIISQFWRGFVDSWRFASASLLASNIIILFSAIIALATEHPRHLAATSHSKPPHDPTQS